MATFGEIINLVCDGAQGALGLNTNRGALQQMSKISKVGLLSPGTEFAPGDLFSLTTIQNAQIDGKLLLVDGIGTFQEVGNDDTIDTKEDDTQYVITEGKYKFDVVLYKGIYSNKQMQSISGFGRFNIFLIDDQGNWLFTKAASGGAKGFTTGMIKNKKYQFLDNQTGEQSGFMFQLLNRLEMDKNYALIPACEFDGDASLIEGISEVALSFVNTPSDTDTTITFKAVLDQDQKTPITGLASANTVRFRNGGVAEAITPVATATEGVYTATVSAVSTSDVVDIEIHNAGSSKDVIVLDNYLYKSARVSATVV